MLPDKPSLIPQLLPDSLGNYLQNVYQGKDEVANNFIGALSATPAKFTYQLVHGPIGQLGEKEINTLKNSLKAAEKYLVEDYPQSALAAVDPLSYGFNPSQFLPRLKKRLMDVAEGKVPIYFSGDMQIVNNPLPLKNSPKSLTQLAEERRAGGQISNNVPREAITIEKISQNPLLSREEKIAQIQDAVMRLPEGDYKNSMFRLLGNLWYGGK